MTADELVKRWLGSKHGETPEREAKAKGLASDDRPKIVGHNAGAACLRRYTIVSDDVDDVGVERR